ncbi:MAG: TatD family hydrolase [Elusimicrobiales bacterium]
MEYFDAHNHLQFYPADAALDAAMAAAAAAGVTGMLCCGTSPEDWGRVLEISCRYPGVTPCFGLHPWYAGEAGWQGRLEEFLRRAPGACVGEVGLDAVKARPGQLEDLEAQLGLARAFGRPAVLHCVRDWGALLEQMKKAKLPVFLLHGYGGPAEMVKDFAALGGYFSFGAALADPGRERLRAALAAAPADRLLFETEAPDAGGPAGIKAVVAAAAAELGRPDEELAELSAANAGRFVKGSI